MNSQVFGLTRPGTTKRHATTQINANLQKKNIYVGSTQEENGIFLFQSDYLSKLFVLSYLLKVIHDRDLYVILKRCDNFCN